MTERAAGMRAARKALTVAGGGRDIARVKLRPSLRNILCTISTLAVAGVWLGCSSDAPAASVSASDSGVASDAAPSADAAPPIGDSGVADTGTTTAACDLVISDATGA